MSTPQNDPYANIEQRIRTMRILWFALVLSLVVYFVAARYLKPAGDIAPNPLLSLVLIVGAALTTLISFPIRNSLLFRTVAQPQAQQVQQAYIVGWAINEVGALLGMLDFILTGNRRYYIAFVIAGWGLLLHFPKREAILNASFKS
ncbi:MAG TPA: hypothetical protein VFI24_12725 [Pyrinomonadaceae bacterium]|nr:hypothetical protein [Pyrinomonadaceae bacterium]